MSNILNWFKNHMTMLSVLFIATISLMKVKGWIDADVFDWLVTVGGAFGLGGLKTYVNNIKIANQVKDDDKAN